MKKYHLNEIDNLFINSEIISQIEIFKDVLSNIQVEIFSSKENIIHFNHRIDKLYFLMKGKAKIYMAHDDGKLSLIQFLKEGNLIGELTLLEIEKQPKDVIAINECVCLSIPLVAAKEKLLSDNKFLMYLNRYLGNKLLNRTEFFAKNQSNELKNRLAAYILLTENEGIYSEKHTETAEFLGTSYRHLLYTLKKFEEEKLLFKQNRGYLIEYDNLRILAKDI